MRTGRLTPLAAALLAAMVAVPAPAGEPTVADLIALAPTVKSSDSRVRSIEIAGYSRKGGSIAYTYRAIYQAPDRFAFVCRDGRDGTPVSISVGRRALIYDPMRPEVLVFSRAVCESVLDLEDGKLHQSLGFNFGTDPIGQETNRINLDLRAAFEAPVRSTNAATPFVDRGDLGCYVLVRKVGDHYRRLRVDLRGPKPALAYEIATGRENLPEFVIDRIVIDGPPDDSEFTFPELGGLPKSLRVREIRPSVLSLVGFMGGALRAFDAREMLHETEPPQGLIFPMLDRVRRRRVEDHDKRYAAAVRSLIPPDPVARNFGRVDEEGEVRQAGFYGLPPLPGQAKSRVKDH